MTGNTAEVETADIHEDVHALARRIWRLQMEMAPAEMPRLPSERELSQTCGVTRETIRRAISVLETEGLVYRMPRSGTFVRRAKNATAGEAQENALRCVNFLEARWPMPSDLRFVVDDYIAGYMAALDRTDIKTRFEFCPGDCSAFESLLWRRQPFRSQACILVNLASPPLLEWLGERAIPFVVQYYCLYPSQSLPPHHRVYVNKAGGVFKAMRHLVELGHRRIGFMGTTPASVGRQWPGHDGYTAGLVSAGIDFDPACVVSLEVNNVHDTIGPAVDLLKRGQGLTAVLTENDMMAIGVVQAARSLGLRVPEDLSVVGVNDQSEAAEADPPLTTVAIPRRQLAATSVEMLLSVAREHPKSFQTRIVECELVARQSTCPPPQK